MTDGDRDEAVVAVMLKATAEDTRATPLRLFARSTGGYLCPGEWALDVAKRYIKSTSVLKQWALGSTSHGVTTMLAVVVNDSLSRDIVKDCLMYRGVAVEVYERDSLTGEYEATKRGAPGDYGDFELELLASSDAGDTAPLASTAAVYVEVTGAGGSLHISVGACAILSVLRRFVISTFEDNAQLTNLDAFVTQYHVRTLLYCTHTPSQSTQTVETAIHRLGHRSKCVLKSSARNLFVPQCTNAIQRLLRHQAQIFLFKNHPLAARAASGLLNYASQLADEREGRSYDLQCAPIDTILRLDSTAVAALHLVSTDGPEAKRSKQPTSIFGWLNRCATEMGRRTMRQWILQPLRSVDAIHERLDMVEALVGSPAAADALSGNILRRCVDMDQLTRKLQRGMCSLRDVHRLLSFVALLSATTTALRGIQGRHRKLVMDIFVAPLEDMSERMRNLELLIESTVDATASRVRMKPEFDDALLALDAQVAEVERSLRAEHEAVLRRCHWTDRQCKLESHHTYGFVLRVGRKDDAQLRERGEWIVVQTSKDGVRFMNECLSGLNAEHRHLSKEYSLRQLELQSKLMEAAATYLPVLDDAKELVAQLDALVAWASTARLSPKRMVRPRLLPSDAHTLRVAEVWHPLLEVRRTHCVPNSLTLGAQGNAALVTGPNMGGKSTLLRSVGIAVVLAQAGCFVPATEVELSISDAVMCRVGANDAMGQGLSTFMVEMVESGSILSSSSRSTVVLIDELGRGTSTYDGFGLAWAIAEAVGYQRQALLLFATHFHEMTELSATHPRHFFNVHFAAEISEGNLQFTYKLLPGPSLKSFGIDVAELANLPPSIIQEAKRRVEELEAMSIASVQGADVTEAEQEIHDALQRMESFQGDREALQQLGEELRRHPSIGPMLGNL